jgi:hypothetical protein
MNWNSLIFGKYNIQKIKEAVKDETWQRVRRSMLGTDLKYKYTCLLQWLGGNDYSLEAKIQVTNYVNALKRGGLIK